MPRRTYQAFLECSGNGRGFFSPAAKGGQWRNDADRQCRMDGVPLHVVLDKAGVKDGAIDVVSQGGDFAGDAARAADRHRDGRRHYARPANERRRLPAPHGGPVRLFVPGWGGVASTKWLIGLTVLDRPSRAISTSKLHRHRLLGTKCCAPVRDHAGLLSDLDARRRRHPSRAGQVPITGYAWSGLGGIAKVEVSTDNGAPGTRPSSTERRRARLGPIRIQWDANPGPTGLLTRATDDRGTSQPGAVHWNQLGYQYNAVQRMLVNVG